MQLLVEAPSSAGVVVILPCNLILSSHQVRRMAVQKIHVRSLCTLPSAADNTGISQQTGQAGFRLVSGVKTASGLS